MNEQLLERFNEKLRNGGVFGPFMKTCDPAFVECAGFAGCDFAILDMEHGPVSLQDMQNNIRAAQVAGILPIVRVPTISEEAIAKPLDVGAAGVQIPQVTCAEDARRAVRLARFHPAGERGVCRFVRAAHYSSLEGGAYFPAANRALVILQLEGLEAVRNLDGILDADGVDIVFIGPYDLSQSLGLTGRTTHPRVVAEMKKIVDRAAERSVVVGTFTDSAETMKMWMDAGVQYISHSTDMGVFTAAYRALKAQFEAMKNRRPVPAADACAAEYGR